MLKFTNILVSNSKLKFFTATFTSKIAPVELAYDLYGSGNSPPLIILHSLCGTKSNWRSICLNLENKLEPSRKIYALDVRNHGSSEHSYDHSYAHIAADTVHFLREQKIKTAVVMGHSMGGRAMMYLALKYPKLVERAIILDVSPLDKPPPAELLYSKIVLSIMKNIPLSANLTLGQSRALAGERIRQLIPQEFEINYLLQNLIKNGNANYTWSLNIDALQNYLINIGVFPKHILEHKFCNPVLFIGGFNSHYINSEHWPMINQSFPNSILSLVDAGHLVHIEQPEETVKLVANFLNCT